MTSARRLLGTAFLAMVLSGCATTTQEFMSSHLWPWRQEDESAQGLTADLSKPFPKGAKVEAAAPRPSEFDFNHPLIEQQVARFQDGLHGFYERALARSGRYVPVMQTILERHGVPKELAYLPLIESGYDTCAVSPAGAVGPWQFIYGTGVRYGLRIDKLVDERRDPIKSTEAAAKYLRDLYDMFNDWHLALAAYNTGEGNIGRILGRGKADDYWGMIGKGCLVAETENYVPKFMAALEIAQDPEAYGFEAPTPDPIVYDWVRVNKPLPLRRVAEMSNVDPDQVKLLNPALRQGVVPPSGYIVKLPKGSKQTYQAAVDQVDPELVAWNPRKRVCDPDDGLHCVKRGETFASIAAAYGVSARELLQANRRSASYRLRIGEALVVPGRTPKEDTTVADAVGDAAPVAAAKTAVASSHTVRRGETPASIGKRYGISAQALMTANGIRNPASIKAGQKLSLPNAKRGARPTTAAKAQPAAKTTTAQSHTVRRGETPATIAARYGTSTQELLSANGIRDAGGLQIGQKLRLPDRANAKAEAAPRAAAPAPAKRVAAKPIAKPAIKPAAKVAAKPAKTSVHTVRKGDTPASIAGRYGVSAQALMRANGLRSARSLQLGQKLTVPRVGG